MAVSTILSIGDADAWSEDISVTNQMIVCLMAAGEDIPKDAMVKVFLVGPGGALTAINEMHHLDMASTAHGPATYRFHRTGGNIGVWGEE